jgi:hypothetical protein
VLTFAVSIIYSSDSFKSPASSTGESSVSSDTSEGSVYARSQSCGPSLFAIMYAWYMPKDQQQQPAEESSESTRHGWESAIIWLSSSNTGTAACKGIAVSARGGYSVRPAEASDVKWEGSRPCIEYRAFGLHRELGFASGKGGEQPLVAWEDLSQEAREALEKAELGNGSAPFTNKNYLDNLEKARIS